MNISGVSSLLDLQKQVAKTNIDENNSQNFNEVLENAIEKKDDTALRESCDELESYMLGMMFKQMKSSMLTGETIMGKGDYEEMFEDTYIDHLCSEMVKAGGIGLSDAMYKQMTNSYKTQMDLSENTNAQAAAGSQTKVNEE